jgi:hypothetical protein
MDRCPPLPKTDFLSRHPWCSREESKTGKSHFYSEHGTIGQTEPADSERLQTRAARFQSTLRNPAPAGGVGKSPRRILGLGVATAGRSFDDEVSDVDWKNFHIVGTCRDVDKEYLRQTTVSGEFVCLR